METPALRSPRRTSPSVPGASTETSRNTASKGLTFDILAIAFEAGRGYEGKDRWALTVKAADRESEILTLGSNPKRDEQLRKRKRTSTAAARSITSGSVMSGNAYYLMDGDR